MRRPIATLLAAAALIAASAPAIGSPLKRLVLETRVVPPLADPALVPGVGRCTSDGACTVDDGVRLRPGTPLVPSP